MQKSRELRNKKKKTNEIRKYKFTKIMHKNVYKYKFAENERKILNIKEIEI